MKIFGEMGCLIVSLATPLDLMVIRITIRIQEFFDGIFTTDVKGQSTNFAGSAALAEVCCVPECF